MNSHEEVRKIGYTLISRRLLLKTIIHILNVRDHETRRSYLEPIVETNVLSPTNLLKNNYKFE